MMIIVTGMLAACGGPPLVVASAPGSLVLARGNMSGTSLQQSFDVAAEHCRTYQRDAVYVQTQMIPGMQQDQFQCRALGTDTPR